MAYEPPHRDPKHNPFLRQAQDTGSSSMYDFKNFYVRPEIKVSSQERKQQIIQTLEDGIEKEEKKKIYAQMDQFAGEIIQRYTAPHTHALAAKHAEDENGKSLPEYTGDYGGVIFIDGDPYWITY